jgi:hypothetical protein
LLWAGVLGLELCGGYGGLAGRAVSAAGWADCEGEPVGVGLPPRASVTDEPTYEDFRSG